MLLVTIDTLRADHLSAYGYERPTSPYLEQLAAEGVRFDRAYSTSSWTIPSLVSLLTSTYPATHRVGSSAGGERTRWENIPAELSTLAEAFKARGYRTFGITANFGLPPERGFGRGFDRYQCVGAKNLEVVREQLEPWLSEMSGDEPWFLWVHLFDPHAPYEAREPELDSLWPADRPRFRELEGQVVSEYERAALSLDEQRKEYVRALYDSEIRHVDGFLEELLERVPRVDDALFVFTADHGEEFQEHGGVGHGHNLFEESIRIPLILRLPDRRMAGSVVTDPVSLVDVFPTLLAAVGGPAPVHGVGRALLRGDEGRERPVVAELLRNTSLRACIGERWKFVYDEGDPSAVRLFDLDADPEEREDLSASEPERVERFRSFFAAYEQMHAGKAYTGEDSPITPEQEAALRALGYVR